MNFENPFIMLLIVAFIVEFFTSRTIDLLHLFFNFKLPFKQEKKLGWKDLDEFKLKYAPYISVLWGIFLTFILKIKFFHTFLLMPENQYVLVDMILSGIIVSKGSNFMHDLRKMLQAKKM